MTNKMPIFLTILMVGLIISVTVYALNRPSFDKCIHINTFVSDRAASECHHKFEDTFYDNIGRLKTNSNLEPPFKKLLWNYFKTIRSSKSDLLKIEALEMFTDGYVFPIPRKQSLDISAMFLNDKSDVVKKRAIYNVGVYRDGEAYKDQLFSLFNASDNNDIKFEIFRAATKEEASELFPFILESLASQTPKNRVDAINILRFHTINQETKALLLGMLNDPDEDVRRAVVYRIAFIDRPSGMGHVKTMLHDPSEKVRDAAQQMIKEYYNK